MSSNSSDRDESHSPSYSRLMNKTRKYQNRSTMLKLEEIVAATSQVNVSAQTGGTAKGNAHHQSHLALVNCKSERSPSEQTLCQ